MVFVASITASYPRITPISVVRSLSAVSSPPDVEVDNGNEEDDFNDGEDADDKRPARRGGRRRKERRVFGEAYRPAIWNTADQFLRRLRTVDADTRTSFVVDFERAPLFRIGVKRDVGESREKSRDASFFRIGGPIRERIS